MKSKISNVHLKFACQADWANMQQAEGGRFCTACQKTVYDFTDARQQEFLQILTEQNGNVCGRFRIDQVTTRPIHIPVWRKWIAAAMVLLGINTFTNKTIAQTKKQPPIIIKQQRSSQHELVMGMVIPYDLSPSFPGGIDAFAKFLKRNIKYKKGAIDGKVIASFIVKKDGSLSNFKTLRGLNSVNNAEVLRVLKLSPKWNPGLKSAKVIDVQYSVPVNFTHEP